MTNQTKIRVLAVLGAILSILAIVCGIKTAFSIAEYKDSEAEVPMIVNMESSEQVNVIPLKQELEIEEPSFTYYEHIEMESEIQELLWEACKITGCPYELALSVIWNETRYQNIKGDSGASYGYMQVQPRWHQARMDKYGVTPEGLLDPYSNFLVGTDFLSTLLEKYSVENALSYYNSGGFNATGYVNKVLGYMNETFK